MDEQNRQESTAPARAPQRENALQQQAESRGGGMQQREHGGARRREHRRHREREPRSQPHDTHQPPPEASLNMEELRELFTLFTAQGFTEFELEREGFRVRLRRDLPPPVAGAQPNAALLPHEQPQPFGAPSLATGPEETRAAAGTTAPSSPTATAAGQAEEPAPEPKLHTISSPIVGTFYRAASPTSDLFVRVGSPVEPDTVVCIIEAMKLMNEIQAETTGIIEKVYVENGQPVEYGQPLFGVRR